MKPYDIELNNLHGELYLANQDAHDERDCQQDATMRLVEYEHSHVRTYHTSTK